MSQSILSLFGIDDFLPGLQNCGQEISGLQNGSASIDDDFALFIDWEPDVPQQCPLKRPERFANHAQNQVDDLLQSPPAPTWSEDIIGPSAQHWEDALRMIETLQGKNVWPTKEEDIQQVVEAEDKRRRNNAASARFRVKKKQREEELKKKVRGLKEKTNDLAARIAQLEEENRDLRKMVLFMEEK
ncbi:hypothetical protein JOL62DRAFT_637769 [Phyllosticta paracitricarpa]|uniref:BZIP domain-containing protein n=2 Tax=Phyllosticta TaxID=121621 RepID=A0ABR1LZX5_9PEZI